MTDYFPIEFIADSLYSFGEDDLATEVLHSFGRRANKFIELETIAKIFFTHKKYSESILYAEKCLDLTDSSDEKLTIIKNIVNSCNYANYPEKTLKILNNLENLSSDNYTSEEILVDKSFAYIASNQKEKGIEILKKIVEDAEFDSENIEKRVYHNFSGYYFHRDDINNGLKHFLKGGENEAYTNTPRPPFKKWDGSVVSGKTIIIDAQCGCGDEVMSVRFMKNIEKMGMKPIWVTTRPELVEIFKFNGFEAHLCNDIDRKNIGWKKYPKDTEWVYALSIPYYLNLSANDLGREPYLSPLPKKENEYSYLEEDKNFKIGALWNSSSGFQEARFRAIPAGDMLKCLSNRKNVSIYSLQGPDDEKQIPKKYQNEVKFFDIPNRNFADTFSIISKMDLVITACTSVAHIAASMGKEVCVITPILEYYAWTSSTGKSWWYGDNVHIFRQKKPREWKDPLKELNEYLNNLGI